MTRFDAYQESIRQLTEAILMLDQAHATMKDAQVHDVQETGPHGFTIWHITRMAESLLRELHSAECGECGHAISMHEDWGGCQAVVALLEAPCGCEWGHQCVGAPPLVARPANTEPLNTLPEERQRQRKQP